MKKIKELLTEKPYYEYNVEQLKKIRKKNTITFYLYLLSSLLIIAVFFTAGGMSLNDTRGMQGITLLIAINCIITSLSFGLMIFLWMINESSYYKMLQIHADLMIYLKEKEEKEKRYQ